jgi:hypothetical protein
MTSLYLIVAHMRHGELCVLGCKFVVRRSQACAYLKPLAGFLVIPLRSSITNFPHFCYHQDDPLIQSP